MSGTALGAAASSPSTITNASSLTLILAVGCAIAALVIIIQQVRLRRAARKLQHLRQTEDHDRLMAQELDHRVKNNLSAVMSLAEQTAAHCDDMAQFNKIFLGRLRAMAQAHEALAQAHWKQTDIRTLAELILAAHLQTDAPQLHLDGDAAPLPARATLPVCLVLHELATNAAKHGALTRPDGRVDLNWTHDGQNKLEIRWTESGLENITAPHQTGMGTRLIRGLIEYELQGQVDFSYTPNGLCCIIRLL